MRLLFFGTGSFAEPTLELLLRTPRHEVVGLVTNPDRPAGRGKHVEHQRPIKTLAQRHGLKIFQPLSVNAPDSVSFLRTFAADLFVVAAYGQILAPSVLAIPPRGAINVHASLLPKYRGAAPIAWAIWEGETETGVTIIRLTPQLDAGDMLAVARTPIKRRETAGALEARLAVLGADLALQVIDQLAEGEVTGIPQDSAQVTRAPKLTKEHGQIDWKQPANRLERQVYALQPWPTAYSDLHRPKGPPLRIILNEAEALPDRVTLPPGAIALADGERLVVSCGEGSCLSLIELQPDGRKRQSDADFQRGYRIDQSCRFFSP
jgi:methionyl-tRNA formyltransferase